jgi:hypothetical protein
MKCILVSACHRQSLIERGCDLSFRLYRHYRLFQRLSCGVVAKICQTRHLVRLSAESDHAHTVVLEVPVIEDVDYQRFLVIEERDPGVNDDL